MFPLHHTACGILVPIPWIKPVPSVLKVQSYPLDHQGILRVECVAVFHWLSGDSFSLAELWLSKKEKIFLLSILLCFHCKHNSPFWPLDSFNWSLFNFLYCASIHTSSHTQTQIYIYIYIYTHTHTHIHIHKCTCTLQNETGSKKLVFFSPVWKWSTEYMDE